VAMILVAEDELRIREVLIDTLLDAGYDVIEAGDGEEALVRIREDHPDVLLLDLTMPKMDGFQVLENLQGDPDTASMAVVLLTAMEAEAGEKPAFDLGVSHYLTKPWEEGEVEATIRVALREAGVSVSMDPGSEEAPDGESSDDNAVNLRSDHTINQTKQDPLARLKTGRKKDNREGEEVPVIKTANKLVALEQKMGGGLPLGSVTLTVGAASSGKSSLCQHLVYGALEGGYGTAYFTSEQSSESLIAQMSAIGLGVSAHLRKNQLRIHGVPEPTENEKPEVMLNQLSQSMERLSRGAQFIVVDSLTDLAGSCPEQAVIAFFSTCRRLGNQGRTILVSVHSYAFGSEMFNRLRTLCDGYITLGSEQVRGKSVRTLEVNKIGTTELNRDNMVSFVVEPEIGMRLIPLNKTKA